MQFNFNFEAFEKSGKDKNEAIKYLKGLNSSLDFDKLESDLKGDTEAIYNTLKGGNFSFSKPSIEDTREKLLKNKENEALKAEFNAGLSWLSEEKKQDYNFYDFKKAKERANSKQGLIKADLEAKEKELKRKEALLEKRLENENIFTKSLRDTADNLGLNAAADVLELGLNKLGFKDENYIFESEKEDIKNRALKSVREKLERGDLDFNEREKYALRAKYDELDYKKALEKEKEKLRLIQKDSGYHKSEVEFMEEELGFFHTLFNDDKDTIREFKDAYKSEGIIGADVQKAINVLKQFEESELLRHVFSDKKQELQQEYLKNALVIAELNGFDDVGLSKENELYFIKKDKDKEQKYLVNTGFLDNFWDLMENSKFEIAGGIAGGIKGFNSGKSAKGKAIKSILGAAAGSFGGGLMDAKIADMYLNRESDYERNLEYALQAGLLSLAGDGVIIAAKPMVKGVAKGAKGLYTYAKEHTPLGLFSTIPSQNINAANKIIDEVFSPEMKEDLKQAQKDFGGGVRAQDLANPVFEKLKESFAKKYGQEDKKTKSVEKLAEIFNQNSLKTKQQEMLDLIRSDKDGSTLAYLLEVAKDDVKIQNNLKNMLNLASANVEKNLKNLNINPREIKSILDEFEAGNKAAFKEVENQIAKLYNEDIRVVLDRNAYENIKEDFLQNGVNLDEMTPFLRDLENNVFSKEGVSFAKLNNFRKNLNYYIFNKDKTPNFINTLKKIAETSLKAEIDKGIDNIFKELPKAYESIKELYSTSLKDYAAMKELNESIKNLKLQDSAKSADEVVDSLIKYAKGQGEGGENNLQKIKAYLGEENNAFLEMQILNRLFKESMVENDRAKVRVFDSESFLNRVKELVGGNELYERKLGKEFLEQLSPSPVPKQLSIDEFLNTLENFKNKENFLKHIEKDPKRKDYLNLIEPTLKEPDLAFKKLENGVEKEKFIKKFSDGKDFFYLLATKDNKETILTAFKTDRINTILKEFNADIIPTFIRQGSKGKAAGTTAESITQPLFKSKEAREFLELVEGFDKLYKNDAIIAKNFTQGTASKLSTSIATSAEGAIKQKVVKGGFDPIFRLLPDGVLFGLFSKQIQGGALRYHLKKALSRSLNYDDFKLKLERELKRTNFNSNTSRLIEKLMQNLEDFNAEKEAKLAQIREVKRAQELEELKRLNQIKTAQENAYHTQEANLGQDILEAELKEDFGINFEGFKGKEAVLKLLEEKRGQVKGAFYKEGLGEIDLVWGDENFGLRHILNRHGGEFENLARELSEAVENGKIVKDDKGRLRLEYENKIVGIKDNWKGEKTNHWVVTAYVKKEKEASLYASTSFTKGEALPLNSKQSIAQKAKSENALPLNDEPLEVEIIEEASFNEPMKFLEFQQKKLLTYIKQNTPLRLLEHKIELKTRDILNFLEQSALNGKEKAFLMRHLERDLDKIEAKIKEKETKELIDKNKELQEHIESTPQKVDNSTSQSLAQTKLSPSAQAKKALKAKQAKQIYEFFTAKGTNKDKITTLENFSDFMFELNKKLDGKWQFLEQQSPNDLAKYKQILTEGIEQAEQVGRISPKQKQRALQDLDLLIDNFSYIKDTHIYSFHPSKVSETLHKIQYKAYDLEHLSDDEFMKILLDKKLPKTLDKDFEREFNERKDRIYPFLKPMLAKDNYLEYISEQNLKDFFYKGVLRDEAIPEMIAKEKGVKIQDLSIAKIQDFKINSPRQSIEQALEIKPLKEFGTNYAEFYKDGKGAIQKLLAEKQGQVSGAFYKEGLGDIDLVWGDDSFGLKHILDKHGGEFENLAEQLDEIIAKGEVLKDNDRATLKYVNDNGDIFKVGLKGNWKGEATKNKWIITAYKDEREKAKTIDSSDFTKGETLPLNSKQSIAQKAKSENTQDFKPFNDSVKDDKQAFLQFIKIMQDTKNGDFYPSENLQNALEKSGKKANENALLLFIKEYENKDAKLVELLKNIQETRIANKALSLIKYFTKARMMQSAIKAVPSDILKKYVNIDASQRMEVLSSLYSDFSNIMKEIALKGKKIPDPAALSEKGGAYVFNRQYRKILNIYEKIQENEELLRLLAHKNDYKTTIEIIQESKAKGLSVKQTKEAIEENKKQTTKLFDEVLNNPLKSETKPKSLDEAYTPKHSDEIKEANVKEEIKQIIDNGVKKGRDMQILGEENFTPEVVEYIHKNKAKAAIDKLEKDEAENLGFKYSDDVRLTIDSEAIQHTLKRHGAESDLVKNSGQIPVEYKDIAEYRNIVKNANESLRARDNAGNDIIVSYKQINGYAVVVEQIRKKNNELSFKTMFKQNGDYKNSKSYKETSALNQTLSIGYEPSANSFSKTDNESIAQNAKEQSHFNDIIQENEGGNQNAKQNQGNEFERAKRTMQDDTGRVFFKNELDKEKAHDTRGATGGNDIHSTRDELTASQILQESDTKISKRGSTGASGRGYTAGEENEKSIRMEDSVRSGGFSADDTHLRQNNTRPDDNERFNEGKAFKSIRPLHEKTTRGSRGLDNRNLPQQILNKKWSEALEKRGILSPLQNAKIEAKKEQATQKYTFTESANEKQILEDNYKALEGLINLEKYSKSGEGLLEGWDREYKKALANFKGFGKATNALLKLKDEDKAKWDNMLKDLTKTLGVKINIADLVQRSKDAYYTPDKIIEKMVQLVDDFAKNANKDLKDLFKLEPSAGIGRFFNHLPTRNSYAVEKDRLSAKMSEWLYPGLRVDNSGYEKSYFKLENEFDLIIGNPPYANFKIGDKDFKENIHNYFMKKNVDNLKADGISLQIITHNFMDAKSSYTRDLIAKDAEFLGAVRLPNTTFKDASVTTDIIAFRKRNAKDKDFDTSWAKSMEALEKINMEF